MNERAQYGFHTRAVQSRLDHRKTNRPLSEPIVQTATFEVASSEKMGTGFRERADCIYTRFGNPTLSALEKRAALLERGESALVFGSGMGAITASLMAVLKSGDHVVAQRDIFAQTFTFLDRVLRALGIETTFVDATELNDIATAMRPETVLIYIETPSNPLLKAIDISAVSELARRRGLGLYVDSTFGSPYLQNPLALGATLVLHSATKFLGGHSDVTCGFAIGDRAHIKHIHEMRTLLGGVQDPHAAWLVLRGMKTLGVRVQRQSDSALEIARFLEQHEGVQAVHYPWLESSPWHEVARRQMRGGGGVISFEPVGGVTRARSVLDTLELIPIATSLGGVETVVEIPRDLDFHPEEIGKPQEESAITPGLIRLSVGLEDPEDLIRDLDQSLHARRCT